MSMSMWKKNSHNISRVLGKINTSNSLLRLMKSWKVRTNNGLKAGAIVMELFKAFDSLNYELLLDKIKTYGLDNSSLTFTRMYNWGGLTDTFALNICFLNLFIYSPEFICLYVLMIQNKSVIRILSQYK